MNYVKETTKQKKEQKWVALDGLLFWVLLGIYTVVTFTLFTRQAFGSEALYHSDMKAYLLEMQGQDSGYPFPYPLFFWLSALFHFVIKTPEMAMVTVLTGLNSLSVIATKYYGDKMLSKGKEGEQEWKSLGITLLVFALFFVSMLYSVTGLELPGILRRYRGVFSPNPYHNATYLATRPFAIVTFFLGASLLEKYEEKISPKEGILFGTMLFLTTITKPSFTFVFVPAVGLVMVYRFWKQKGKNFLPSLSFGLVFLPTFGALLYQYFGVFGPVEGGESGIGVGLGTAWAYHCQNIPLALLLGMAFPLLVLVCNGKALKTEKIFRLSWQLFAVGLVEALLFYEKGYRVGDINFSWGYMHGMFFAFLGSAFLLWNQTMEWKKLSKTRKLVVLLQWGFFFLHLVYGLWYFRSIMLGELYY